jgi:hypothetical protein
LARVALIENRHGLIVDAMATEADGRAERDAGLLMVHAQWTRAPWRRRIVGADKAYDVREFIDVARDLGCTPHVEAYKLGGQLRNLRSQPLSRFATRLPDQC